MTERVADRPALGAYLTEEARARHRLAQHVAEFEVGARHLVAVELGEVQALVVKGSLWPDVLIAMRRVLFMVESVPSRLAALDAEVRS